MKIKTSTLVTIWLSIGFVGYFAAWMWTSSQRDEWRALYLKCSGMIGGNISLDVAKHWRMDGRGDYYTAETITQSEWDSIKARADIVLRGKATLGPVRWFRHAWAHIIMRSAGASWDGRYCWQVDDNHWIVLGPIGVEP